MSPRKANGKLFAQSLLELPSLGKLINKKKWQHPLLFPTHISLYIEMWKTAQLKVSNRCRGSGSLDSSAVGNQGPPCNNPAIWIEKPRKQSIVTSSSLLHREVICEERGSETSEKETSAISVFCLSLALFAPQVRKH